MNDTLDNELKEIEAQLANLNPNQMPDDILMRMEQAMISWEDHLPVTLEEEKIVPFNGNNHTDFTAASATKKINLNTWGAAAAIALMTGIAAVFMTDSPQDTSVTAGVMNSSPAASPTIFTDDARIETNLTPELSRNITHASSEGITYAGKNDAPFKVLRIEYTEKVITHDNDGNPVITTKPCVEHVLVPVPLQ
jgi:hypothetical protein